MKKGRQASYSIEDEKNNLKYNFLLEDYLQIQKVRIVFSFLLI